MFGADRDPAQRSASSLRCWLKPQAIGGTPWRQQGAVMQEEAQVSAQSYRTSDTIGTRWVSSKIQGRIVQTQRCGRVELRLPADNHGSSATPTFTVALH